ncbi:hypothetical protein DMUE_0334 [Dictyocoela muelleri]|nr:hypothetical protein DMUE_0334 [Dictyocoela muelleri]
MKRKTIGGKPKLIFEPKIIEETLDDYEETITNLNFNNEFELFFDQDEPINNNEVKEDTKRKINKPAINVNLKVEYNNEDENVEFISELPVMNKTWKQQVEPLIFNDININNNNINDDDININNNNNINDDDIINDININNNNINDININDIRGECVKVSGCEFNLGDFFLIQMPNVKNPVLFKENGRFFIKSDDGMFLLNFSDCKYNFVEINDKVKQYGSVDKFAVAEKIN